MMPPLYIIDTSYLWEFVNCGRDKESEACKAVRHLLQREMKKRARLYVPLPCIFELANHIAGVKHLKRRQELADWLFKTVSESLNTERPWIITPADKPKEILPKLLESFRNQKTEKICGVVDLFVISEAVRLKEFHKEGKAIVHIWTNDRAMKRKEPDTEANSYHWS